MTIGPNLTDVMHRDHSTDSVQRSQSTASVKLFSSEKIK